MPIVKQLRFFLANGMKKYAAAADESNRSLLYSGSSDDHEEPEEQAENAKNGAKLNGRNHGRRINFMEAEGRISISSLDAAQRERHCHALLLSSRGNGDESAAERLLYFVAIISGCYIVAQFTGGILANSLAIIADSGHVLTDLASFLISIYMLRISKTPATRRFSFGLLRAEYVGALCSLFIIWTITSLMVVFATQRIVRGEFEVNADVMLVTSLIGVAFNLFMAVLLKFSKFSPTLMAAHSHSHNHNNIPQHDEHAHENVNIRAAFIHVFGDLLQSIGVLFAALLIRSTGFQLADPLCTYLFSLIVICTSVPVARDIFMALMEATPNHLDHSEVAKCLLGLNFVRRLHSLQIWSLNTTRFAASVHLVIEDESKSQVVTKLATSLLQHQHGIHFTSVQIELDEPATANFDECNFCQNAFSPTTNQP